MADGQVQQAAAEDLHRDRWDVAVVGAGPAGSTAALCLARDGWSVLLLDGQHFPREKVCGDGLIDDAQRCLQRLGLMDRVLAVAHRADLARVYSPSRIFVDVPGRFLTLRRRRLDALLAASAVQAGATFARGRVSRIDQDDRRGVNLHLGREDVTVRARTAVLATGADVRLARGLGVIARRTPSALALRTYYRSPSGPRSLVISYDRSIIPGYGWIFPMGEDVYNVGCGVFLNGPGSHGQNVKGMFDRFVTSFPPAREILESGERLGHLRGAPLRCELDGLSDLQCGRILLAGETAGATFPFTGEGIGKSMQTGEMAARAIHQALHASDPSLLASYSHQIRTELSPIYDGYRVAQRWLGRAWLNDLVARRARRSAHLRATLSGVLQETVDPRRAFSLGGILRSLWG